MIIKTEKDRIKYLNTAFKFIHENISDSNKKDIIILSIFKNLNKEKFYYNGDIMNFTEFIHAVVKDTTPGWFGKSSYVKTHSELKTILIKLMTAIRNVIVRKENLKDVLEFIENEHGFNISNKDSVNILNFIINYKFFDNFDTYDFLKTMYPELSEKVVKKDIPDPPEILDAKVSSKPHIHAQNQTRKNNPPAQNKRRNAPRNAPQNQTRKNAPKNAAKNGGRPKNAPKNTNKPKKEAPKEAPAAPKEAPAVPKEAPAAPKAEYPFE